MYSNKSDTILPADDRRAFSPAVLAKRWGCCRQTIYNMMRDGQLNSFKLRDSRLIPLAEIERIESGAEA